jgi:DNA-binding CsgD family transcriptional regulator/tetratricopeptide (TPR) repeat protein
MVKGNVRAARDWFSEMQQLFQSAHYVSAAKLYDAVVEDGARPANDAVLLRARLFLKTDSKRIVPFLLKSELQKPTPTQVGRRAMYLGTGYSRLGDFTEADQYFVKAKGVFRVGSTMGELAAHITRRYLEQRNLDVAEEWQKKSLVDDSLRGRIRSEHLASYIFARRERYREQAESIVKVLNLIGNKREQFVEDWYVAVHTLAVLARELPFPEAAKRAKTEVDLDFEWSSDFSVNHFQALKGVAWSQALSGDELSCLRYLRLAQLIDVGPVWRAILYLDRSYFASIVGEQQWAANEFSAAEDLAEGIAWDETSGEERVALLLLAELATLHAAKRAPFYIARFSQLGKLRSNVQHLAFDARLQAMEAYATGIVRLASGDDAAAGEQLRLAWGTFDRIGYDVRATSAAMALYRATQKARWLHLAEEKLERYPRSWLARNLGQAAPPAQPDRVALSKMQGTVMRLVCEGLSTDEMAERLELSRNTILNHLKVVYRKIGVNSRQGLVLEAMKRNLVS